MLQSDGRQIQASLIHGDLWEGKVGTHMETGDIVLYDAGSYYAHNEMELGEWRAEWGQHLRAKIYARDYLRNFPAADPIEEFDDRNRLYSLKYSLNYSAGRTSIYRPTFIFTHSLIHSLKNTHSPYKLASLRHIPLRLYRLVQPNPL